MLSVPFYRRLESLYQENTISIRQDLTVTTNYPIFFYLAIILFRLFPFKIVLYDYDYDYYCD